MENITCGLTRAELDAHQVGISQLCPALKPDGTQCNCPYSAHLSAPAPAPAPAPGISAEMKEEFKEIVREAVIAIVALMNPIPPTQPTSVIPTPGHGGAMNAHIPELPPADIDPWETYVVTRNPLEKDYYYKKLFPRFKAVNGDDRFRLSKHTDLIMIKDGSERIFKCDRNNASFQRNLYLEFHDCDYNCEVWKEKYLNNHSMDYKETDSPPLHFIV